MVSRGGEKYSKQTFSNTLNNYNSRGRNSNVNSTQSSKVIVIVIYLERQIDSVDEISSTLLSKT